MQSPPSRSSGSSSMSESSSRPQNAQRRSGASTATIIATFNGISAVSGTPAESLESSSLHLSIFVLKNSQSGQPPSLHGLRFAKASSLTRRPSRSRDKLSATSLSFTRYMMNFPTVRTMMVQCTTVCTCCSTGENVDPHGSLMTGPEDPHGPLRGIPDVLLEEAARVEPVPLLCSCRGPRALTQRLER